MNIDELAAPTSELPLTIRRSKKQLQSAALAAELASKANWKRMLPQAKATWPAVPGEELAKMEGNIHRLAGAVQLRYHLSRQEADRQVQAFFAEQEVAA